MGFEILVVVNGGLNVVAMSEYLFGEKMPPPEKDKKLKQVQNVKHRCISKS